MAMTMEVVAELDCTNAVRKMPMKKSRNGFRTTVKMLWIASRFAFMESDIRARPINTSPSPARILPVFRTPSRLQTIAIIIPANASISM